VLVHGAWVDGSGWKPVYDILTKDGYTVTLPPSKATKRTESNGQVGNLELTPEQEQDLVNFIIILNDGLTKPNPVSP